MTVKECQRWALTGWQCNREQYAEIDVFSCILIFAHCALLVWKLNYAIVFINCYFGSDMHM